MAIAEFELILLDNGDVGLRRVGGDQTLVRVNFSAEVREFLGDQHIEVAKSMIDEGIKTVYQLESKIDEQQQQQLQTTIH